MLELIPITISDANIYIKEHHRHHQQTQGGKFAIGCTYNNKIVGVIIVGRPVARHLDNGWTAEVTRLCVDGTKNACSKLYSAAWRACRAMGYKKLITYILSEEPGTSLKSVGWKCVGKTKGGSWDRKSRPRIDKHPLQEKLRWEIGQAEGVTLEESDE
jgi:hypothetical protein